MSSQTVSKTSKELTVFSPEDRLAKWHFSLSPEQQRGIARIVLAVFDNCWSVLANNDGVSNIGLIAVIGFNSNSAVLMNN